MSNVAMVAGMEVMHGFSNTDFSLSKADLAVATAELQYGSTPWMISLKPGGRLVTPNHCIIASLWEQTLVLSGFAFPAWNASISTALYGPQNASSTGMVFHRAWLLSKDSLTAKEVLSGLMTVRLMGLTMVSSSWVVGLTKQWNGLLRLNYSTSWVALGFWSEIRLSRKLSLLWIGIWKPWR